MVHTAVPHRDAAPLEGGHRFDHRLGRPLEHGLGHRLGRALGRRNGGILARIHRRALLHPQRAFVSRYRKYGAPMIAATMPMGDLVGRDERAAHDVGSAHEHGAHQQRRRDQHPVVGPHQTPGQMRAHQTHETQAAAHRAAQTRHRDGDAQEAHGLPAHVDAQARGGLFPQPQHVEGAALVEGNERQHAQPDREHRHVGPGGTPDVAGDPVLHKGVVRIGQAQHEHGGEAAHSRGDGNAHEQKTPRRHAAPGHGQPVVQKRHQQRPHEGQRRQHELGRQVELGEEHEERRHKEAGARVDAQDARLGHVVAGHALEETPRKPQANTHEHGGQDAGKTQVDERERDGLLACARDHAPQLLERYLAVTGVDVDPQQHRKQHAESREHQGSGRPAALGAWSELGSGDFGEVPPLGGVGPGGHVPMGGLGARATQRTSPPFGRSR